MEAEVQAQATQVSDSVGSTSTGLDPNIEEGGGEQLAEGGKPIQEKLENDSQNPTYFYYKNIYLF